jgi:hypothetical protein
MWSNVVSRTLRHRLAAVALLGLSAVIQVGCGDRETILTIQKPTDVYAINQVSSSPPPSLSDESSDAKVEPGKVIRVLKAGETAKAIGVYHGKDYDAFHVKLADGTEGLIIAGDTFTATSH